MPIQIIADVQRPASASATFTAQRPPAVQANAVFFAQRESAPASASASFIAFAPPPQIGGEGAAVVYQSQLDGLPNKVLSWEYSHSGATEELTVRVLGQYGMETPTANLKAVAQRQGGELLGQLPLRTFQNLGQEPAVDVGGNTTEFRFKNSFDQALRGQKLPELIPWKLNPTPDPCAGVRQTQSISALVQIVMQRVDRYFSLEDDPLREATWIEGRRDFSTLDMTPQALWDATYGALGMVLHLLPMQASVRLVGRWPIPLDFTGGPELPEKLTLSLSERREWLQTPARLTVRGADDMTELTPDMLLEWLGTDHPAYQEIAQEVMPNMEWWTETRSGTTTTRGGKRKMEGQIVAEVEFTTDDVKAEETVDGKKESRQFYGVITGYTLTLTTYDPDCPQRPISQRSTQKTWAYTPFTQTNAFLITGPGVYSSAQSGDLNTDTVTLTSYSYSPQGHQTSKTVSTSRLGSLEQQGAEEEPKARGAIVAREVLRDSTTETWSATGGGRWRHSVQQSVQSLVPLYDKESQEAVRTTVITRNLPPVTEYTDQAPPSFDCKPCAADKLRDVADSIGAVMIAGDAGFAEEQEIQLGFADKSDVGNFAQMLMQQRWGRVLTSTSLAVPLFFVPGTPLERGMVQSLRISQAEGQETIDTTLELVRPDDLWGKVTAPQNYTLPLTSGHAVMLAGAAGGALARIVTGWNLEQGKAVWEQGFIRFRTGFPPRPGDEIEWRLVNGVREATNAR